MLSSLLILLLMLSLVSFPVPISCEEGLEGSSSLSTELDDRSTENEQVIQSAPLSELMEKNQQTVNEVSEHHLGKRSEQQRMGEERVNKIAEEADGHHDQSMDGDDQSNIPSEYRKYIPHGADAAGSQSPPNESGGTMGGGEQQNGGDYQKYIPDEYKHYANAGGEGSVRVKKSEQEVEVNVEGSDYHHRADRKGEQEEQHEEEWRNYIPAPYRKYVPSDIPSEEHLQYHHEHHHEKHHQHHHDKHDEKSREVDDHHEKKDREASKEDHPDMKKKDEKKEEHHRHHASGHHSEKEDHRCEKADHHQCHHDHKYEKKHHPSSAEHHHQKLFESDPSMEKQIIETSAIKEDRIPISDTNNTNGSFFSSSVWVNIGVSLSVVVFACLIYYLLVHRSSSIIRESKFIIDEEIGRIPATAMEKSHLLAGEIRIYHEILKNEPVMQV